MTRVRTMCGPSLIALGVAAELSSPGAARAEGEVHMVSPGLTFSISVGDKTAFGVGFDVRYSLLLKGDLDSCNNESRAGVGLFAQAMWVNFSAGRFAAGAHGGGESYRPYLSTDGEIGWTYRMAYDKDHPGGHGLHLGAANLIYPAFDLSLRGAIPWFDSPAEPELTMGLGFRYPPPFGLPTTCIIGRPLRTGDGVALPGVVASRCRGGERARTRRLDPTTRGALARAFLEDGRAECASIPAFIALARELRAVGAPARLVRRALASARDEARHTAVCCALAGDYAGAALAAEVLPPPVRLLAERRSHLARLAVESWEDGCLCEGAAAERARRSAAQATDPHVKGALAAIAADEARHAELAWHIVAYCVAEGGRPVREALAEAVFATPGDPGIELQEDVDPVAWTAHGRLTRQAIASAWEKTRADARRRAEGVLGAA